MTRAKTPLTKERATEKLVDGVCGRALNAPDVKTDLFRSMLKKAKGIEEPEALAFIAGVAMGSSAVARRWVERNPASALAYWAGPKAAAEAVAALKSKNVA